MSRKLRVIFFSVICCSAIPSVLTLIFTVGDMFSVVAVAATGALIGVFAAPSIEPKAFKRAWLYEMGAGGLTGALLGLLFGASIEAVGIGMSIGAAVGYLAPFWIKHVTV